MENQNVEKKNGWGGRRAGAGRPRGENHYGTVTINIPKDVAEVLANVPNRSAYIIEALREYAAKH